MLLVQPQFTLVLVTVQEYAATPSHIRELYSQMTIFDGADGMAWFMRTVMQ